MNTPIFDMAVGQKIEVTTLIGGKYIGVVTVISIAENLFAIDIQYKRFPRRRFYSFTFHNSVVEGCRNLKKQKRV